jgi:molybdopterin synthase sulfur carrier subunit
MPNLKVTVRLFSVAKDLGGFDNQEFQLLAGAKANDVMEELARRNPRFNEWRSTIRLAVNQEYVTYDYILHDGDEVAVIPPVSGG